MKKYLAVILCVLLVLAVMAGCSEETETSDPHAGHDHGAAEEIIPADTAAQSHDHNHINYKGLSSASYTLEDVIAAEGAEPAFSFEAGEITYYAYNDITEAGLYFSQVQHSFMGEYNRVSCTSSGEEDPAAVLAQWQQAMTALYGEPLVSDNGMLRWTEHTGNYVTLTQLNEDTVQLCFYFTATVS